MVSMKDIAKQCNVSVASVSKALNGYPDISEETRQLILNTASEMGYLPNSSARSLKTKRSHNLGVLFVDEAMSGLTHDYFNHVLESFKRTAESRGYNITFTSGNVQSWNNYFIPALVLHSDKKKTLPVLIAQLRSADFLKFDMGQVYVMIAFSIFPVIIVYILLSRFIVEGVSAGAVKG